jgi:hypothetical protein
LPSGVSLNADSGIFSGKASQGGQFDFSVQVGDSSSPMPQTAMKTLRLVVALGLQITPGGLLYGQAGVPFRALSTGSGGVTPYTWTVAGALPSGLSLNASSGVIAGTPTQEATSTFAILLTDSAGQAAQKSSSITIAAASAQALAVATTSLPNGSIQTAYPAATMTATGGIAPYTWSVIGSLPTGLSLSAGGSLTGTPAVGGSYKVAIKVTDNVSATAQKPFTIYIFPHQLDSYGGLVQVPCPGGATTHFTAKKITWQGAQRWVLCTPAGNAFFSLGMQVMAGDSGVDGFPPGGSSYTSRLIAKYPPSDFTTWAPIATARIKSMGFNSCGPYGDYRLYSTCPYIVIVHYANLALTNSENFASDPTHSLYSMTNPSYFNFSGRTFPDVYSPQWTQYINRAFAANYCGCVTGTNAMTIGFSYDDRDNLYGFGPGPDLPSGIEAPHLGWVTLITSPTESAIGGKKLYADPKNYTKYALRDRLQTQYGTIGALNAAWGASYTSFGTSGTPWTNESIGTGTGAQTTFTFTLAHTSVSQYSVIISVGSVPKAADYSDTWYGPGVADASGSLNRSTGAGTVAFSVAPGNGVAITATYVQNGWGLGTGFLDEAGQNAWVCNSSITLSGCAAAMKTDLDGFLNPLTQTYATPYVANLNAYAPGVLKFGMGSFNSDGVSRAGILAGMAAQTDVIMADTQATDSLSSIQQQVDQTLAATGDKPIWSEEFIIANPDSPYPAFDCTAACFQTQAAKGNAYSSDLLANFNLKGTNDGIYHILGSAWFQYYDNSSEHSSFGITTRLDNAYDGLESVTGTVYDWQGYTRGGESSNYGNVVGPVTTTNYQILSLLAGDQP